MSPSYLCHLLLSNCPSGRGCLHSIRWDRFQSSKPNCIHYLLTNDMSDISKSVTKLTLEASKMRVNLRIWAFSWYITFICSNMLIGKERNWEKECLRTWLSNSDVLLLWDRHVLSQVEKIINYNKHGTNINSWADWDQLCSKIFYPWMSWMVWN